MVESLRLETIPKDHYSDYRYEVIFNAYKWDPQVNDHNTVSPYVVVLNETTAQDLASWAEALSRETMDIEEALLTEPKLQKELGLPRGIRKALKLSKDYRNEDHVRLMRFDFHPTVEGWALSEVNSDVPGGFAEASVLPTIVSRYYTGAMPYGNLAERLADGFNPLLKEGGRVAFVHATSYSDDRQVMQYMSDYFNTLGIETLMAAPDHIRFHNQKATSIQEDQTGEINGILRFFPLEWLNNLSRKTHWQDYYRSQTPSCNHPVAILTQSKRLPLVWDKLGVSISTWKKLLPETKDPRKIDRREKGWIYKPALGRVGEGISITEAISSKEHRKIEKSARRTPKHWVAQKRFNSQPLVSADGTSYHLCVGVFTVNGIFAGFYGRISPYPRIDANAKDLPILVQKEGD